nr:stimulated by retinoic acid gene 6 protein-like [Crassostrea gigas]
MDFILELLEFPVDTNFTYTFILAECPKIFPHQEFRLFLLVPAVISTLILAFSTQRTKQKLQMLNGRPGLIFPMDVLKRSHRFSYAAAFGTLARLCAGIVFDAQYAFDYNGPTYLKVLLALVSMLIYGLGYFPLFAGITTEAPVGYFIATLFSWVFTAEFIGNYFCKQPMGVISYVVLVIGMLPETLCFLYLSISLPVRFVASIAKPKKKFKLAVDFESSKDLYESIRNSYQGIHVKKLFKRPPPPPLPPKGIMQKLQSSLKSLLEKIFYKRTKGFRYSARMISVMAIGFILLYEVTFLLFVQLFELFDFAEIGMEHILNSIGRIEEIGEDPAVTSLREILIVLYDLVIAFRGCFLTSLMVAFTINVVFLLHYMTSYRSNLLSLYKGKNNHLTPKNKKSNASLIVGSMRYAGYQVGYIGWGFFIQFFMLIIVTVAIALIVILWDFLKDFILDQAMRLWPVLLTSLVLNITQLILSKFLFLQKRGEILAMDNRRLLFIFTYFMFFYNIFIGIFSCLMRILKSIILGALFLPRLDHSTLPRKFQKMDPGFDAYCGFMHIESTHTNPVAMVFISILQAESLTSLKKNSKKHSNINLQDEKQEMLDRKRRKAKWKWLLAYTLVNNPEISLQRRLVLAEERNENIKEIFFSRSSLCTEEKSSKIELDQIIIQDEKI